MSYAELSFQAEILRDDDPVERRRLEELRADAGVEVLDHRADLLDSSGNSVRHGLPTSPTSRRDGRITHGGVRSSEFWGRSAIAHCDSIATAT